MLAIGRGLVSYIYCTRIPMIEHKPHPYASMIAPHDFGKNVEEFDEPGFLKNYKMIPLADWNGSNWYPLVLPQTPMGFDWRIKHRIHSGYKF